MCAECACSWPSCDGVRYTGYADRRSDVRLLKRRCTRQNRETSLVYFEFPVRSLFSVPWGFLSAMFPVLCIDAYYGGP